jgi:hypothetical protein
MDTKLVRAHKIATGNVNQTFYRLAIYGLQKLYDPIIFLHAAADAKKARRRLPRLTKLAINL